MTVGSLVAFLSYFTLILIAVMMGTFVAIMAPRAAVCAERIQQVLDTPTSVLVPHEPVAALREGGSVELRDVGFGYPGAQSPVLSGVTLRSLPGQTTAIIGSTGSGKTTLVNLVARLIDVTSGAVLVGGVDVRELDPEVLWQRIGLVPQKPYLFSGTVATNLRYGKPDATDEELWAALEVAQARDFVAAMPGGLDAEVAQGVPTSPAGSASALPSPGRWSAAPRSTCSTTRSPHSTSPRMPASALRSPPTPGTRRSSWWPSGCRPSPAPTRSSSSRTGRPWASAATRTCW
jgi:ATP-binding cassette subfamily B protein